MILVDFFCWVIGAYLLVREVAAVSSFSERLALAVGLALGMKSLFLFLSIVSGIQPGIPYQLSTSAGLLLAAGLFYRFRAGNTGEESFPEKAASSNPLAVSVFIILGILCIQSFANALFFPITETDALWYEIRGMRIYHETRFDLGIFNEEYPPLLPLLFAYQVSFQFAKLKVLFPVFYLCLLVIFYHRVRANGGNGKLAAVLTLILGTTPYMWWHSVLPFLNLFRRVNNDVDGDEHIP